jgi:hypothetical protein
MPISSPVSLPRPSEDVDSKEGRHRGPLPGARLLPREVLRTINTCEKSPCLYCLLSSCSGLLNSWTPKQGVIGDPYLVPGYSPGVSRGPRTHMKGPLASTLCRYVVSRPRCALRNTLISRVYGVIGDPYLESGCFPGCSGAS